MLEHSDAILCGSRLSFFFFASLLLYSSLSILTATLDIDTNPSGVPSRSLFPLFFFSYSIGVHLVFPLPLSFFLSLSPSLRCFFVGPI